MKSERNSGFSATGLTCGIAALVLLAAPVAGWAETPAAPGAAEIHFDFDSDRLRPDARSTLQGAGQTLATEKSRSVRVIGYADAPGSTGYNYNLGARRANAAAGALIEAGVAPERITVESRGESEPVVRTLGRSELNRRVLITPAACNAWRSVAVTEDDEAVTKAALKARADEAAALHAELAASGTQVGSYQLSTAAIQSCGIAAGYGSGAERRMEYAQRCLCDSDRMRLAARD